MAIIQNWKIRTRSRACSHTGVKFADGDHFYTCIFVDPESDGYLRKDFSNSAWDELGKTLDPQPFSHWRSKFERPEAAPKAGVSRAMDKDSAETLLQQMMEDDDPATDKARYILIVMLERKKLLKQVGEKQVDDRRLLIYEHVKSGEVFIATDPQIRLEEIAAVQEEVVGLLDRMADEARAEDEGEDEEVEPEAGPAAATSELDLDSVAESD